MPSDTSVEKGLFPCESVSEEEIYQSVIQLYVGTSDGTEPLKRGMVQIPMEQVPWLGVTILHILDAGDSFCNTALEKSNLACGTYVNRCGNILLLIHPNNDQLFQYLQLCRHGLRQLYIFNSEVSSISGLENLSQLTSLSLYYCRNLKLLPGLEYLSQLTSLKLWDCWRLTSIPGLKNLTSLTSLDLYNITSEPTLSGLENLTQLTSLKLSECRHLTSLPGLENLTSLTSLKLYKCEKLTSLPGLENLTQLTSLELHGLLKLTSLPRLENLTQLTSLKLCYCHNLRSLPELENLSQLTSLDLSYCNNLTFLPSLENLSQLTSLELYKCEKLTALPAFENLSQLTFLNLSWCENLTSLPKDIRQLKSLRYLNLKNLQLRELPDWLPEIAEHFTMDWRADKCGTNGAVVNLSGTTIEDMDMSIFEQPYDLVAEWFKNRNKVSLNEMKVIFLGDGEAGKSYTISRLVNNGGDPVGYEGVRTPGIAIKNHLCQFNDREFKVNYWDFGGQEIMHAMHRVFLTNRTMYVVLVSVEDDDYQERAEYWLRNIKSFAPIAPVLLAFNKIDIRPRLFLDEKALRAANGNLKQIVSISALEFDQEKFDSEFRSVLLQEIVNTGTLDVQWPKSWIKLKSRMENLDKYYIPLDDYEEICTDCQVEDVGEELLKWFNDLGVSFYFPDNLSLEDQVILNPRWITNGLYIILFNQCKGIANGIVPRRSIHSLLKRAQKDPAIQCTDRKAKYTRPGDVEYVLGIMRQFCLSLQIGEDREFIPMLCQPHPTLELTAYETDEEVLEFHMEFEYLPNNVLHRLMVEQYSELDPKNVWRTGAQLQQPGTGLSAVVAMDENTLKFFISHSDSRHAPQTYLTALKAKVDQIWQQMGLQPPEESFVYKNGRKRGIFGCDELKYALQSGNSELYSRDLKRSIPIADLLCQFGLEESVWCEPSALRRKVFAAQNQNTPSIDEQQLLEYLVESCQNIQGEHSYRATGDGSGRENQRNRRIRDDLKLLLKGTGYLVSDQSERGFSKSGQGSGELDILLEDKNGVLRTVIEALRIHNCKTKDWEEHLTRLLGNYNYAGLRVAYLVTYVDANEDYFLKLWEGYQKFIPTYNPGKYSANPASFRKLNTDQDLQYIQKAVCSYTCVSAKVTVYHLFVMVKPQPPKHGPKPKSCSK